jgi:hypothetical protein
LYLRAAIGFELIVLVKNTVSRFENFLQEISLFDREIADFEGFHFGCFADRGSDLLCDFGGEGLGSSANMRK